MKISANYTPKAKADKLIKLLNLAYEMGGVSSASRARVNNLVKYYVKTCEGVEDTLFDWCAENDFAGYYITKSSVIVY